MSGLQVFLDETPGETRGVIARGDRFERLLIQREGEGEGSRLRARSVGRVVDARVTGDGALVDLGEDPPFAFLPLKPSETVREGEALEVEVTAEPRERKGPTVKRIGPAEGAPRLLASGPDVRAWLAELAPGVEPVTGLAAIRASRDAEEEALGSGDLFADLGLDLAVERTRALVAVDIDHAALPGRDRRNGRARANQAGLREAARMIRLKRWGGLVAIDLAGTALDAEQVKGWAKAAFAGDGAVLGPLSRFGLFQLSLPWRFTPIEEILLDASGVPTWRTRAQELVRRLRMQLITDTATPRLIAVCTPEEGALAAPWVERLGPRAGLRPEPAARPGLAAIREG